MYPAHGLREKLLTQCQGEQNTLFSAVLGGGAVLQEFAGGITGSAHQFEKICIPTVG